MKHIKKNILTIVLISIILALILNIKENKNIADDILFLKSIQKNEEEKNQKKQNKIRENQEKNMEYKFNVSWKNTNYNQVNLTDTIKKQTLINKKIAPGLEGRFNIILTTNKDSKYYIKFENKSKKPNNLKFQELETQKETKTLEELQENLQGTIEKNKTKTISIRWYWPYQNTKSEDTQDTIDSKSITNYLFNIYVIGETI